jgi:hypothetical protein
LVGKALLAARAMLPAVQLKLWEASEIGDAAEVKRCLEVGAKVEAKNRLGWNAMHRACMSGSTVCVAMLLPEEERVRTDLLSTPDGAGYLPLHIACGFGHAKVVELLSKAGSKVDAPMVKEDSAGDTAMHTACKALSNAAPERQDAYLSVIVELLKRGGLLEAQDAKGRMAAAFLTKPLQGRLLAMLRAPPTPAADDDDDEEEEDDDDDEAEDEKVVKDSHRDGGAKSQPPPAPGPQEGGQQQAVELEAADANTATERIASLSLSAGENGGTLL